MDPDLNVTFMTIIYYINNYILIEGYKDKLFEQMNCSQ